MGSITGQSVTITTNEQISCGNLILDNLTTFIVAIAYWRAITIKNRNSEVETEIVSELDNLIIFVLLKEFGLDAFFMDRITKIFEKLELGSWGEDC